jgi:iron complex transport system substrate-binding protein
MTAAASQVGCGRQIDGARLGGERCGRRPSGAASVAKIDRVWCRKGRRGGGESRAMRSAMAAISRTVPRLGVASLPALLAAAILIVVPGLMPGEPRGASLARSVASGQPSRIVSLDVCTDQLLIALGDRAQIAAVTRLVRDPLLSAVAAEAQGLPAIRGGAEEVLGYDPDLVLAGPYGVTPTVRLLQRLHRNVLIVPLAEDLAGVRRAVHEVASAIGAEARGAAMVADFDARLERISLAGPRPTAAVYGIGGAISAPGSLADAALAAAGYRNMAAAYRLTRSGGAPLETLLANPPDLLVVARGEGAYRTAAADNLRHPALRMLRSIRPVLALPSRLWLCGTPQVADAVARLAAMRGGVLEAARQRAGGVGAR